MEKHEVQAEIYKFMLFRVLVPVGVGGVIGWYWPTIRAWF